MVGARTLRAGTRLKHLMVRKARSARLRIRQIEGDVPANRLQIACIIRRSACCGTAMGLFLPRCLTIERLIIPPFTGRTLLIGVLGADGAPFPLARRAIASARYRAGRAAERRLSRS